MIADAQIYANIQKLPVSMKVEVSHYVDFLLEKVKKSQSNVQPSISEQQQRSDELYELMTKIAKEGTVFDRENIDVRTYAKDTGFLHSQDESR
ncbi:MULTISPECIES: DUF2281 domain-containing protein [unclassified Moraxella]|uniref:DUF2281 domain-containing protein n=1 Tax=unclassified Moraxella TaxID=2685852 RepID=UPI003AF547A8